MAEPSPAERYLSFLTLAEIRRYLGRTHSVMMTVFFGVVYALIALTESGMLVLTRVPGGYTTYLVSAPGTGPGLLILAPWGILELPFFGLAAMALVTVGVAIGMAVAVRLAIAVVRSRASHLGGPASVGARAGLTPAMVALVAFGACCSTTAAATAGIGVIAQVSGSTTAALLLNSWFLSLFQLAVVWIALVAQEALLRVYGVALGLLVPLGRGPVAPPIDRRRVAAAGLRVGLLVGGITWALAVVAQWTTVAPSSASAALWVDWVVVHGAPSALAVTAALFPGSWLGGWAGGPWRSLAGAARAAMATVGLLLLVGTPAPLAGAGLVGAGDVLAARFGAAGGWGGLAAAPGPLWALAFTAGVQMALLGGFSLALALAPRASAAALGAFARDAERAPRAVTGSAPIGPAPVES